MNMTKDQKDQILDLMKTHLPAHISKEIGVSLVADWSKSPVFDSIVEVMFMYGQNIAGETEMRAVAVIQAQSEKLGAAMEGLRKIANTDMYNASNIQFQTIAKKTISKVSSFNIDPIY